MREKAIKAYCRQVSKGLFCTKAHKKALLDGLKLELEDKADDNTTFQDLERLHGTVISTINNLHLEIPEAEQLAAKHSAKIHRIAMGVILASAAMAIFGLLLYASPFYIIIY